MSPFFLNITRFFNLFITNYRVLHENIFLLPCGEYSRRLSCILPTLALKANFYPDLFLQTMPSASRNCSNFALFRPFVKMLLICLSRHHLDLTFKDLFPYVVVVDFYVFGPCVKTGFSARHIEDKLSQKILTL